MCRPLGLSNSYAPPPPPPPLPPRPYSPPLPILLRNASGLVARSCADLRPLHLHPLLVPDPSLSNSSVTSCSTTPSHTPHPHLALHFRICLSLRPSLSASHPSYQHPHPDHRFPFLKLARIASALATLSATPSRQDPSRLPSQETCTRRVPHQPPPPVQTLGCIPALPFPFLPPFADLPYYSVSHPGLPRSPHSM